MRLAYKQGWGFWSLNDWDEKYCGSCGEKQLNHFLKWKFIIWNYTKDVSGLTANTTQLLPYKNACDSREVLKMWSNSVPRVMVLSCFFCLTLLKNYSKLLWGTSLVKNMCYILPQQRWNKVLGVAFIKGSHCCQPGFWHTICSCKTSASWYWFVLTALEVQALSVSLIFHISNYLEKVWYTDKACYGENYVTEHEVTVQNMNAVPQD